MASFYRTYDFRWTLLTSIQISCWQFRFISKTVQDRAIVTMEDESELVCDLSNGAISNDLELPLTQISRSCQYSMHNMSLTVHDRHIYSYNVLLVTSYTHPTFECLWPTLSALAFFWFISERHLPTPSKSRYGISGRTINSTVMYIVVTFQFSG